jgi:hypothetical protein
MDIFDRETDPAYQLQELREENATLKAALVQAENERDDALRSLNCLSMLVQGLGSSIIDAAQSMAPDAPRAERVPPELAADLLGGNGPEMVAPVINLPTRTDGGPR